MPAEPTTRQIRAMLSTPPSRAGMSRRAFLSGALAGAGAVALAPYADAASRLGSVAGASATPAPGVLVLIQLAGGMDGLDVVVPLADPHYLSARGSLAVTGTHVLDAGATTGLHPALDTVASLYAAGQVAIVRGVDYPSPDLSHFLSMQDWMTGLPGADADTGWIGRWLDGISDPTGFEGIALDSAVPLHMKGAVNEATTLDPTNSPGWGSAHPTNPMLDTLYPLTAAMGATSTGLGPWGDAVAGTLALSTRQSPVVVPLYGGLSGTGDINDQMILAARIINAGLGARVISVSHGSFDTHHAEAANLAGLLADLDAAIATFYKELAPANAGLVTLATWSEFGRRVQPNASGGTDHGTANAMLVIGPAVRGGLVTPQPSLAPAALDVNGNLVPTTDFRQVYATLLESWLGADPAAILPGATSSQLETLPLFAASPTGGGGSSPSTPPAGSANPPGPSGVADGYWLVTAAGQVFNYNRPVAAMRVSAGAPVVAMAASPSQTAWWLARSDGGVIPGGTAAYFGSMQGKRLNAPVVSVAATATGRGYWLLGADGGVFCFGDASFHGSTGAIRLNKPAVGMAATPTGNGYWFVASDGGVFTFGDAEFFGSTGDVALNRPVVGMAPTPTGRGYWLVASDGGIFEFGDARFYGSTGNIALNRPVVGMAPTPTGRGYWLVASDGGVFTFGDAEFVGSAGAHPPAAPVLGIVT